MLNSSNSCRVCVFLSILALAACTSESSTFQVTVIGEPAVSAELQLCSSRRAMKYERNRFSYKMYVSCEGSGEIVVRLRDGSRVVCPIGYVTHGLPSTWEFVLAGSRCAPKN